MAESIQCYQCGTRMTLEELASNDGDCPECDVEIHLAEYLSKALADIAVLRTQQSSQRGEAVAWRRRDGVMGCKRFMTQKCYDAQSPQMKGNYEPFYCAHCKADQVAADSRVVPVELLRLIEKSWRVPNGWPKSVPESVELRICQGLAELRALLEVT